MFNAGKAVRGLTFFVLLGVFLPAQGNDGSDDAGLSAGGGACGAASMSFVSSSGVSLCYLTQGEGDAVVLLHGLGSSTRDWEHQVQSLSQSHRVIALDFRGHGLSEKSEGPYSIEDFSDDLHSVIELEAPEGAHLVGISMGAMVAVQYALDHPENVISVVAANSPPDMRPKGLSQHFQVLQRKVLVRVFGMRKVGEVLSERLFPGDAHAGTREVFVARWAENDPVAYRHAFNAILDWGVTDRLPEFRPPLLVLASDQDYLPLSSKQPFLDLVPNATLEIMEDSRHAAPLETPEKFNHAVLSWLSRQRP